MYTDPDTGPVTDADGDVSEYRSVIETVRDGVFVIGDDRTIEYVNGSLCSLLGRARDDLVGATFETAAKSIMVRPEEYHRFASAIDDIAHGAVESRTLSFGISGDVDRVVEVQVSKQSRDDDAVRIVGVVRDVTERERRAEAAEQKQRVLTDLYEIGGNADLSFNEKAERVLTAGCEYLDLPYGFLTRIEDGVQRMVHTVGDHELIQQGESERIERSYCRETIDSGGLVGMKDTRTELGPDDPAHQTFELGCYIGTKILVGESLYGTFCFAGPTGRDREFTSDQREVVKLLGQWAGYELGQLRSEERLRGLHRASQQLLVAKTAEEVAETTVAVAAELFDLPLTAFWVYDDKADVLRPLAETDEAVDVVGEAPSFERGEGLVWESFDAGDVQVYGDITDDSAKYNPRTDLRAEVHVPCGTHGVIMSAATEPRAFDTVDVESLRLLGALVGEAMTAVRRKEHVIERGEALQRQNARLEKFADVVAHDLRNPLAGATGWLEIARESGDAEPFDRVERSLERMDSLIGELLSIARADQRTSDTRAVRLESIVEEAWSYVDASNATLSVDDRIGGVHADETRLLQLFGNLFRNSIEHGPDDVTVEVGPLTDEAGFYVGDDGPGMSEDSVAAVNDLEDGEQAATVGIGFMSIADVIADHGWDLSVANTDSGLRVEVRTGE